MGGKRLGGGSFDATTGSIEGMFNFTHLNSAKLFLDESTGLVVSKPAGDLPQ